MNPDNIALFQERFISRTDIYAVQTKAQDDRWIFLPQRRPLTQNTLRAHLDGKHTIGAYPSADSKTKWLVTDIDTTDTDELRRVLHRYQTRQVPFLLEHSGRKGYHLWTFFTEPVSNALARRLGRTLAGEHELFPKQDRTIQEKPGNLIKLPLGVHQATERRCLFLDSATLEPLPDQWEALRAAITLSTHDLLSRLPRPRPRGRLPPRRAPQRVPPCVQHALFVGVSQGRRNATALILASSLLRAGLSESATLGELLAWNARNSPPLSEGELASVLRSAQRGRYRYSCSRIAAELGCPHHDCSTRRQPSAPADRRPTGPATTTRSQ